MLQMFFSSHMLIDSFKETQRSRRVSILLFALLLFSCKVVCDSFAIPWTVACQAPLSMGCPGHEYWSRLPFLFPGDLFDPGIE